MKNWDIERFGPPFATEVKTELVTLWEGIFNNSYAFLEAVLNGEEAQYNRDLFYRIVIEGQTAATSHLTLPCDDETLGGLGEVATVSKFCRQGMATALCEVARDDFFKGGGEALFLGTGNPDAARVYHRLGWRKMCGSYAMVLLASSQSPESFLVDYFRGGTVGQICPVSAGVRVSMIPLLHTPHDWKLLDFTTQIFSVRYQDQMSVMGLFPNYELLLSQGGTWFELQCDRGHTVGLATAQLNADVCRIDGFSHFLYSEGWPDLIDEVCRWGFDRGANACEVVICSEDEEKMKAFRTLGFSQIDSGPVMQIRERPVGSLVMKKIE